jgi:carboxylesterase type B
MDVNTLYLYRPLSLVLQRLISAQDTGNFYNFSNVRFAQAPVGQLRFSPPQAPIVDRTIIQTGSQPRVCPQALPNWYGPQATAMFEYLYGVNSSWTGLTGDYDPNESEDCLFLDIVVPKTVFDGASQGKRAPVSANQHLVHRAFS